MGGALGVAGLVGAFAQIASIGSAFWLGGRLIRRGARGRGAPELLLGIHLLLSMGLGSLLLTGVSLSAYADAGASAGSLSAFAVVGNCVTILGLMAALWFNYRVFHAGDRAGLGLALSGSLMMWAGFAYLVAAGGLEQPDSYGRPYWPLAASMVLADIWVATEALRFRAQLRKRLALGLAEPLVVERFALWAFGAIARIVLVLMAPLTSALTETAEERLRFAPGLLLLSALLILGACTATWLMLAPTEAYRRWVERRFAVAAPG
jgi:hypothetical protein